MRTPTSAPRGSICWRASGMRSTAWPTSRGSRADIVSPEQGGPDNDGNLADRPDGARLSAVHGGDVRARRPDHIVDGLVEVRATFSLGPAGAGQRRAVRLADDGDRLVSARGKLSQRDDRLAGRCGNLPPPEPVFPHVSPDASHRLEGHRGGRAAQGSGASELQGLVRTRLAATDDGGPLRRRRARTLVPALRSAGVPKWSTVNNRTSIRLDLPTRLRASVRRSTRALRLEDRGANFLFPGLCNTRSMSSAFKGAR